MMILPRFLWGKRGGREDPSISSCFSPKFNASVELISWVTDVKDCQSGITSVRPPRLSRQSQS